MNDLPNVDFSVLDVPDLGRLEPGKLSTHPPRILLLYGSLPANGSSCPADTGDGPGADSDGTG